MSLSERIHQLNREIGDSVERALAELRQEISQRLRVSNEEIQRRLEEFTPALPSSYLSHEDLAPAAERELGPNARRSALRDLRDALAAIDRARSQADILAALLRQSAGYASRAAVLLVRGGGLQGWGGEGFGDAGAALRGLQLDSPNGAWGRLAQAQGAVRLGASDCAALCSRLESPLPTEGVLVPIVLRDRVAAGLYADRLGDGELAVEALQVLAHAAAQAIETLPFRERSATPTLTLEEGEEASGATAAAVEAPAPAAAPTPEPEPEPVAPEPQATSWNAPEEPAPAPSRAMSVGGWDSSAPTVTEAMPIPGFSQQAEDVQADDNPLSTQRAGSAPESAMAEDVPRYPRSVEEPPPVRVPDPSPDATVLLSRSNLQAVEPAAAPPPLRPVPVPEEPPASGFERGGAAGTPEVRPPSDVDGPGWAFATTRVPVSPDNEAMHEEARRLARLLVSEIKLYNEDQVEEGRRNRDIYERLKEDIDRSRQMYDERVDPKILRSTDYFYQELVRILAAGDSKALGI
jgi:hypothetical protein